MPKSMFISVVSERIGSAKFSRVGPNICSATMTKEKRKTRSMKPKKTMSRPCEQVPPPW
jgi:hypothetical protein